MNKDVHTHTLCCRVSEEHGWELMWLMTGCFAPSTNLLKEVTLFFRSRSVNVLSLDCLGRLQKTLRWEISLNPFVSYQLNVFFHGCMLCYVLPQFHEQVAVQSNVSMSHWECIALHEANSLQKDRLQDAAIENVCHWSVILRFVWLGCNCWQRWLRRGVRGQCRQVCNQSINQSWV